MELPKIRFIELENKTEAGLISYLMEHRLDEGWLVYFRAKYEYEEEWTYYVEPCNLYNYDDLGWLNDWDVGQQCVEYLAITSIEIL